MCSFKPGLLVVMMFFLFTYASAQIITSKVKGTVVNAKSEAPIVGANVYWLNSTSGTVTDVSGKFSLSQSDSSKSLVVSFVGFQNDTISIRNVELYIRLKPSVELEAVQIVKKQKSTTLSYMDPLKRETMGKKELQKAACCNLSESFETSPSVDVAFTDAVTGTKQIQMLGLSGPNVQITRENVPDVRGISSINGLTYIPGAWIESIQLNKGTGTVVNGFESIAGQINVELLKPESSDPVFVNMYANQGGRYEGNLALAKTLKNEQWSTGLLAHGVYHAIENDNNRDNFMDNPIGKGSIILSRWKYTGKNGLHFQAGLKGVYHEKQGGQLTSVIEKNNGNGWRFNNLNKRVDLWAKSGKVFENYSWRTFGIQTSGTIEELNTSFGSRDYNAVQKSGYFNFIYQSIIGNTNHVVKTGSSVMYDDFKEELYDSLVQRLEFVPGVFGEYTYTYDEKFSLVAGLRLDNHNLFGAFATPRLHVRWAPSAKNIYRLSGGRGQRTPNVMAENLGLLASNRRFFVPTYSKTVSFGATPEIAWNIGGNYTHHFELDYREGAISFDIYQTWYENQLVVDLDENPQQVWFYNLEGESYATSLQGQLDYELLPRLDLRLAYRWNEVKTTFGEKLLQKPLVAKHRSFVNLAYENKKFWKFDVTINWQGQKRIPNTWSNPSAYTVNNFSPAFFLINGQISKTWKDNLEIYVGGENIGNIRQFDAIIQSENPEGQFFDSSLIWGPVFGRNIYVGLRYTLGV